MRILIEGIYIQDEKIWEFNYKVYAFKSIDIDIYNYNYNGKIIRPFTTHEGSGLGSVPFQLKKICKGAEFTEGLSIKGSAVYTARDKVEEWI